MTYPVYTITYPADLTGALNGKLTTQLVPVNFPGRGVAQTHHETARAWKALSAACLQITGVTLSVVSLGDAYRSYAQQSQVFLQRYVPYYIAGSTSSKVWNGTRYWLKVGYAMVATPGTSNHGWGLAIDVCEIRPGPAVVNILGSTAWQWLLYNAPLYGFSWESQSEAWHIRLVVGDFPTQRVLDFERPALPPPPPPPPQPLPPPEPSVPVYDDDVPTLYRDIRFNNVFLVNGDVTTIGPALFNSLRGRGVPLIVDVHDPSLISFMRKSELKVADMESSGVGGSFAAPPDLI